MADGNKCGHEICTCSVGEGEEYCSEHCEDAVRQDLTEITCDCRHQGCE